LSESVKKKETNGKWVYAVLRNHQRLSAPAVFQVLNLNVFSGFWTNGQVIIWTKRHSYLV